MKPADTIRTHFRLMRQATSQHFLEYHSNVLYGYLHALLDTKQIDRKQHLRLNAIVTRAWALKLKRIQAAERKAA